MNKPYPVKSGVRKVVTCRFDGFQSDGSSPFVDLLFFVFPSLSPRSWRNIRVIGFPVDASRQFRVGLWYCLTVESLPDSSTEQVRCRFVAW